MREVAMHAQPLGLVLKGGSALAFAYGVGRHTTGLRL